MSTLQSIQQLEALREDWDALAARAESPLLEHDWFLCAARAFCRESDLRIITTHSGSRLTGVAPLALHATESGTRLGLLGASTLHEPGNLLHEDEAALKAILREMSRLGAPCLVQRVPVDAPLCRRAGELLGPRAVTFVRRTRPSLGIDIAGTWEDYWAGLSRHLTQNLPRLEGKARRASGRVTARVLHPAPQEVDGIFEVLVRIEASGWKGRKGSALLQRPAMCGFFREYSRLAAAKGRLRVTVVEFGPDVAAIEFAVMAYGRVWQLKIAFEDRYASFYPGLHLTRASVRDAFETGCRSYEFLGSAEAWEERWRPAAREYAVVVIYPCSVRGLAGAARDFAARVRQRTTRERAIVAVS